MAELDVRSSSSTTKPIDAVEESEFITAPAASTLVASVTSAADSIPSSLVICVLGANPVSDAVASGMAEVYYTLGLLSI